jgi:hypothetical protein
MTTHLKPIHAIAAVAVGVLLVGIIIGELLSGGGYAVAAQRHSSNRTAPRTVLIHACVNKRTHALRVVARCGKGETALVWNQRGRTGAKGVRGPRGPKGATGSSGAAATQTVGSVTTGAPGSQASFTNVGTSSNAIWNIAIPQGEPGANGTDGTSAGPNAYGQVWMGSSSAALAPGANSNNIVGVGSVGVGGAVVDVQGCSSAGVAEPVIEVTADKDSQDRLTGANNTANVADAYVSSWSTESGTSILSVVVNTTNPVSGVAVDSDFSLSVFC